MTRTLTAIVVATGTLGLTAAPALAQEQPYQKPDGSWISLSGTVVTTGPSAFVMDYGDGVITVEMDDWDTDADAFGLVDGDKVTVYGAVDENTFAADTIEASRVFVEDLNTTFHASSLDEEEMMASWPVGPPVVISQTRTIGTVTSVDEPAEEFVLDVGPTELTVEVDTLAYNPLDDQGFQQIDGGDRVSVTGMMDSDFMEGRVLEADSVVTLEEDAESQS
ncbi:hypothetical protein [Roseospira navarrensis]|uniref:DUF5666 domain-containing protein n=1 Tax=Roseospira navarrensis TaxID=140058 RepID=A0A7X1ZEC1_9PROT|nr:hypothetical protein [Roseospira navarrensis]MQX35852.1 hypothetical protein [Roseospira navarrensis]